MADTNFDDRLNRLRALMRERDVGHVLLSIGPDLPYFIGYEASPSERLTMLVVSLDDPATLFVPVLEAPRVPAGPFELHEWTETQ